MSIVPSYEPKSSVTSMERFDSRWAKENGIAKIKMAVWWHTEVPFDGAFGAAMIKKMRSIGCTTTLPSGEELSPNGYLPGVNIVDFTSRIFHHADLVHLIVSPETMRTNGLFHRGVNVLSETALEKPEGTILAVPVLINGANAPRQLERFYGVKINAVDFAHAGEKLFQTWEHVAIQKGYKK